jgi:hypothetical protein
MAEILEKLSSLIFNLIPNPKGNKGTNNFCVETYAVVIGAGQKGLHNIARVLVWKGDKTIPKFDDDLNLVHNVGISDIKRFNKCGLEGIFLGARRNPTHPKFFIAYRLHLRVT